MENKVVIHFKMPSYNLDGNRIMQEFKHTTKEGYFTEKCQK
jgi:hypothetical protein